MKITLDLRPTLYQELVEAAKRVSHLELDGTYTAQEFAQEAIEAVLASRRLDRFTRVSA